MTVSLRCTSRVERVVVYARGAVVTRRVELPEAPPAGPVDLVVPGLSPLAEPGAIRADAGARPVLGLRPRLIVPARAEGGGEARARVRELERARRRLEARVADLGSEREGLVELAPHPALNGRSRRADPAGRFADALAVGALAHGLARDLDAQLALLAAELEGNAKALEAARLELAQATSRERAAPGHPWWEVTLHLGAGGPLTALELSYPVAAARWWPAYSARIGAGAEEAQLALEAFVAQASFEDWTGVRLGLCTADLATDTRLPELPSLRLGRAQPPKRKGFRPPPEGLEALFAGYDQAMGGLAPPPPSATPRGRPQPLPPPEEPPEPEPLLDEGAACDEDVEEAICEPPAELRRAKKALRREMAARTSAPPPPPRAPMPSARPMSAPAPAASFGGAPPEALGAARGGAEAEPELDPDSWLDFDALGLAAPDSPQRGRLQRAVPAGRAPLLSRAAQQIEGARPPGEVLDPLRARGEFDHRYDAEGLVDLPSNALPHRVTLASARAPLRPRFRTVPREGTEVYREAVLTNPFPSPLLGGPLDVFLDGALLATTPIPPVGRGGPLTLGLGVEERLRVARNARAEEASRGVLGGTTAIEHQISVEVASALGRAVELEILDRLPVSDDKDVKIVALESTPAAEPYDQADRGAPLRGGLRWRLPVPAGGKASLSFGYRVELPSKLEVVGGNRRE